MSGHGCPNFDPAERAPNRWMRVATAALFVANILLILCLSSTAEAQQFYPLKTASLPNAALSNPAPRVTTTEQLRVRFSWGGGLPQTWTGKITIDNGTLSSVAPLALTPDATSSVIQIADEAIINHWSPTNYGGADVSVEGNSNSQVRISLTSAEQPEVRFERMFPFDELTSGTASSEIDLLGNRCSVARVPGDELNVDFEREHLIFKPAETFTFFVQPNKTPFADRTVACRIRIVPAHRSGIVPNRFASTQTLSFRLDENGSAAPQSVSVSIPDDEAVYNIEIELEPKGYQASFGARKDVISRKIQVLVLNSLSQSETLEDKQRPWRQVSTVDPVRVLEQNAFSSWTQISRMTGLSNDNTLGNELRSPVKVNGQTMMQLAPGGWQAIPLVVDRLGKPHVIELEYVADDELALGLSVLQPDANGQIPMHGFDSGVYIPKSLVESPESGTIQRHRLTIWPRNKTPYLLVANRHANANAVVGKVNVIAGPDRIEPSQIHRVETRDSRKLMAFFEAPLFSESFGASETMDLSVDQPLDDWRMFYEGADRFIEYLKANSYRGAFITVASDGSAIYPSQLLNPSPKHDNGTFFGAGQDPIRKDILEMLFRMFEREGLSLVPTLAFNSPLTEVESIRKQDNSKSEFDLVDHNRIHHRPAISSQLPLYNPLNRTVQRSVRRVVQELSQRYQGFEAFDGVAIICRPDTFTMLPGRQWGYDATTIQQFAQLQPDLSTPKPWPEMQSLLLGSHHKQWISWRATQMSNWYKDLADEVNRAIPTGKLYLAPVDLYRNQETASALSPSLHASIDFEQVMLHLGFESQQANNVVLLNPHRLAPDQPLSSQRVDMAVEDSSQPGPFFANSHFAGDLFTHRISWAHFAQLQSQSPFEKQTSALMRLQQMAPAGSYNRKRFAQSINNRDARMLIDGGWMMTMGQEESVLDMMRVFGQLPDKPFSDVTSDRPTDPSSLAVRQLQLGDESYFYVVNASPWPTRVALQLESESPQPELNSLSSDEFVVEPGDRENHFVVTIEVPPYGLVGARGSEGDLLKSYEFELPPNAEKNLRRHVYLLQSKLTKAGNPTPLSVLENSSFEINGQPTLGGWDAGQQSSSNVRIDVAQDQQQEMGVASLIMVNDSQSPVWVRSNFFESTETGRISISVWLKTSDSSAQPPLRLSVEGQSNGTSYYRFGSVGSLSPDPKANQIESRWKRFAVHFDDLPVDGLDNVRIGFDLMGPGQVHIDNVQVFDRWFDANDAKAITQLLASTSPMLSTPETFDNCRRLLEGYWPSFLDQFIAVDDPGEKADVTPAMSAQNPNTTHSNDKVEESDRKGPMFRRFRGLVPQRKSSTR